MRPHTYPDFKNFFKQKPTKVERCGDSKWSFLFQCEFRPQPNKNTKLPL